MVVHRKDAEKQIKFRKEQVFYKRLFLQKTILKIVSTASHKKDMKKQNLKT